MNKVILMGRLTHDVDMRQTPHGHSVARFSIAVNRRFAKEGQQQADFFNCVAWRQTGEFISRYFNKGDMIALVGNIQSRSWDGNDNQKHYATDVIVDEVYFTGAKKKTDNTNAQQPPKADTYSQQPPEQGYDFEPDGFNDLDGTEDEPPF